VTGKTSFGKGRRGTLTITSEALGIAAFGPSGFTPERTAALYSEGIRPGQIANARGGFWSQIAGKTAEWVGKKAGAVVGDVLRGYPRLAYARTSPYGAGPEEGAGIDQGKLEIYRAAITGRYPVEHADQTFLQRITGKFREYVCGANLAGRLFVHEQLLGRSEEQYWATILHEAGHTVSPEKGEGGVEGEARRYASYLKEHDPDSSVRERAGLAYRGFLKAEYSAREAPFGGVRPVLALA